MHASSLKDSHDVVFAAIATDVAPKIMAAAHNRVLIRARLSIRAYNVRSHRRATAMVRKGTPLHARPGGLRG